MRNNRSYTPPELANPGNVLACKVGGNQMGSRLAHDNEAPFPEALPEFFVRSFCPPEGIVCDPFSGSGTTGAVAVRWGRRYLGCDVRMGQVELASTRITLAEEALKSGVPPTPQTGARLREMLPGSARSSNGASGEKSRGSSRREGSSSGQAGPRARASGSSSARSGKKRRVLEEVTASGATFQGESQPITELLAPAEAPLPPVPVGAVQQELLVAI